MWHLPLPGARPFFAAVARLDAGPGPPREGEDGRSPGRDLYLKALDAVLAHPWLAVTATALLLAAGVAILPGMRRELVPQGPSRALRVDYRLPARLSREETEVRVAEVETRLTEATSPVGVAPRSVRSVYRGEDDARRLRDEEAERGEVELIYADEGSLEAARRSISRALAGLPGVKGEVGCAAALERSESRIEVEASATTAVRAEALAKRLVSRLASSLGVEARTLRRGHAGSVQPEPAFVLGWNPPRLAGLNSDTAEVARQVRSALGGFEAGRVGIEGGEPEILAETTEPSDSRLLPVSPAVDGDGTRVVHLGAVATVERRFGEPALERPNGRPAVLLAVDAPGRLRPAQVAAAVDGIELAVDEKVRLVGQAEELERSFTQLRWALLLAFVLVFLTVAAIYESFVVPVVVMTTVPVVAAGALGALDLAGQSLNVMSFMGFILLAGIVVNNAIVLVHRIEQRLDAGAEAVAATREAAAERYRPILMTTLTTLLGMIPLAALGAEGVELRRALAVTGGS